MAGSSKFRMSRSKQQDAIKAQEDRAGKLREQAASNPRAARTLRRVEGDIAALKHGYETYLADSTE